MKPQKHKPRFSEQGLMGMATQVHKPKQGKSSYRRHDRNKKNWLDTDDSVE